MSEGSKQQQTRIADPSPRSKKPRSKKKARKTPPATPRVGPTHPTATTQSAPSSTVGTPSKFGWCLKKSPKVSSADSLSDLASINPTEPIIPLVSHLKVMSTQPTTSREGQEENKKSSGKSYFEDDDLVDDETFQAFKARAGGLSEEQLKPPFLGVSDLVSNMEDEEGTSGGIDPELLKTLPTREELDDIYRELLPNKGKNTPEGRSTEAYMKEVSLALTRSGGEMYTHVNKASKIVLETGCVKSIYVWHKINQDLSFIERQGLDDVMHDLLVIATNDDTQLAPYLRCFNRLKFKLTGSLISLDKLEARLASMVASVALMTEQTAIHQEETAKFCDQVNESSRSLAESVGLFESTVIKVAKLDILPVAAPTTIPTFSVPSTSHPDSSSVAADFDLARPGDYAGYYTLKVRGGVLKTVLPPSTHPCLDILPRISKEGMMIFCNLDQGVILNRISHDPNLALQLASYPSEEARIAFSRLCKGVRKAVRQWRYTPL